MIRSRYLFFFKLSIFLLAFALPALAQDAPTYSRDVAPILQQKVKAVTIQTVSDPCH